MTTEGRVCKHCRLALRVNNDSPTGYEHLDSRLIGCDLLAEPQQSASAEPVGRLEKLLNRWRMRAESGFGPTDRLIGISECADELEAILRPGDAEKKGTV